MDKRSKNDYFSVYFPLSIQDDLKAAAFASLCDHLRQKPSEVSNIEMMSVGGFCRNCLAKWLVMTARKLSVQVKVASLSSAASKSNPKSYMNFPNGKLVELLDTFGYDEAAQRVYGCAYTEWKATYQKTATEAQLLAYETSKSIHAKHNAILLEPTYHQEESCTNFTQYFTTMFPTETQKQLQAGAFDYLCQHLQQHSREVSNIIMMTTMGFCRNCLAKWLVLEARQLSKTFIDKSPTNNDTPENNNNLTRLGRLLDAFGYEDAAEVVYGCTYAEWKVTYNVEATDEQLKAYLHSLHLHAIHDKATLKERVQKKDLLIETLFHPENNDPREQIHNIFVEKGGHNIRSNVCCQDIDAVSPPSFVSGCYLQKDNSTSLALNLATRNNEASLSHANPLFSNPIVPPPVGDILLRIGVLTVSDRCFTDQYDSGDLSGPAVLDSIHSTVQKLNSFDSSDSRISYDIVQRDVVPDERNFITKTLHMWSMQCNMIFTTGGTGFAPRDVTPEATTDMLDTECQGLMTWASIVCSSTQILAPLSRGTAGIRGQCVVVNLPGSPSGCAQVTTLLLPLLIHAVNDMNSTP